MSRCPRQRNHGKPQRRKDVVCQSLRARMARDIVPHTQAILTRVLSWDRRIMLEASGGAGSKQDARLWESKRRTRGSLVRRRVMWILFGDHPIKLERYRED